MKKIMMTLALMMTIAISATAMTNREARQAARMMTDKMAYELRLTARQYDKVYDINSRYIDNPRKRDRALGNVLTARHYDKYMMSRPVPVTAAPRHHAPAPSKKHAKSKRTGKYRSY